MHTLYISIHNIENTNNGKNNFIYAYLDNIMKGDTLDADVPTITIDVVTLKINVIAA